MIDAHVFSTWHARNAFLVDNHLPVSERSPLRKALLFLTMDEPRDFAERIRGYEIQDVFFHATPTEAWMDVEMRARQRFVANAAWFPHMEGWDTAVQASLRAAVDVSSTVAPVSAHAIPLLVREPAVKLLLAHARTQGIAVALAEIIRLHQCEGEAGDVLHGFGLGHWDLKAAGVDRADLETLKPALDHAERRKRQA